MLIYQGFSAPQGCPKNIFRQNPLHPFSVLWISYRPRVRFASTAGDIFLPWGEAYSMHPLDLRVADEDEPSHVSGRLRANIPSFGLVIRRRPAKLLWGLKVEWIKSRQLLRCHPVVQRFFRSQGEALGRPLHLGQDVLFHSLRVKRLFLRTNRKQHIQQLPAQGDDGLLSGQRIDGSGRIILMQLAKRLVMPNQRNHRPKQHRSQPFPSPFGDVLLPFALAGGILLELRPANFTN